MLGRSKSAETPESTEKTEKTEKVVKTDRTDRASRSADVARGRTLLARVLWAIAVVFASVLAIGALVVALDANKSNDLVGFVLDFAAGVDLGVFERQNGVFKFDGSNADTKNALVNWGLAAVVWLFVGRIVDRLVRP